jgi:1-acyl-sn-glycerol-3-phosphate acyltransferase
MNRGRDIAFSIVFPVWTALCCVVLGIGTFLPRKFVLIPTMLWIRSVAWIERHVLGLDYMVIGAENLPAGAPCIVAAKHQSTYETMKLHLLLRDPAIVLKKELLRIPIWGRFLKTTGMIPIDRGAGRQAIVSMVSAAERAKAQNRPIVIFPQGTRVAPGGAKSYKPGVSVLYRELDLPIVPLALNSGVFWPRTGAKRGGVVTFSFLPAIEPGVEPAVAMRLLEQRLEAETDRLVALARQPIVRPTRIQEASHS